MLGFCFELHTAGTVLAGEGVLWLCNCIHGLEAACKKGSDFCLHLEISR